MRALVALALLSLLGCACAGGASSSSERAKGGSLRYLALGASYTIGEGASPSERWPVQLAALLRWQGIDVGEPEIIARTGWTVAEPPAVFLSVGLQLSLTPIPAPSLRRGRSRLF